MRAKYASMIETKSVENEHFTVKETSNGNLEIKMGKWIRLILSPEAIHLHYTIYRPYHDHNDKSIISFIMPEEGMIIDPLPWTTGEKKYDEFTYPSLVFQGAQQLQMAFDYLGKGKLYGFYEIRKVVQNSLEPIKDE